MNLHEKAACFVCSLDSLETGQNLAFVPTAGSANRGKNLKF